MELGQFIQVYDEGRVLYTANKKCNGRCGYQVQSEHLWERRTTADLVSRCVRFFVELLVLSRPLIIVSRMINISSTWTQSCETAGVPELTSPNGGVTLGSFITPSTMNPSNLTRSYARSAYIDSLAPRPNLHILTEYTVLKINFALQTDPAVNKVAKNVEFGKFRSSSRKTVDINKELVLAAGALSSPKILMMSGVGPKDVLESVGIKVEVPLPGVGQRLQDHMVTCFTFRVDWLY